MFRSFCIALILAFYIQPVMANDGHHDHDHGQHHDHGTHDHSHHKENAELVITPIIPDLLKAGVQNEVILFIQDMQAEPVDVSRFEVVHTQPVHLLIIEPKLNDYHHAHPLQVATGQYAFSFTPQTACSYRIWVDVQLKGSHQHYIPVDLKGTEECDTPVADKVNLVAASHGYDFKLELEGELHAGEAVLANMSISKDGRSVDFLEPVMGAFAHMVGFYDDYKTIAHIHPMGEEPTENSERGGPVLSFHIVPEKKGFLKLFSQVQIDGKQVFAPFTVQVE